MEMFPPKSDLAISSPSGGQTHWNSIVKAMVDTGLDATNIGGSAVSFNNKQEKQSIIFHRPHPEPKWGHVELSWIGKRLNKNFGWRKESFVLLAKGKEYRRTRR